MNKNNNRVIPLPGNALRAHQQSRRAADGMTGTTMDLTDLSKDAQARHAQILQDLEVKRRMYTVTVPTLEEDVKMKLRELGHPVTLFGEKPEDRLKRLKFVVARLEVEGEESGAVKDLAMQANESAEASREKTSAPKKRFYTPASEDLQRARKDIALYSFAKSSKRLRIARERKRDLSSFRSHQEYAVSLYNTMSSLLMNGSQVGDSRPLSSCSMSKDDDSRYIVTSSWSGNARLWSRANFYAPQAPKTDACERTLRGHTERVQHVEFHPSSCRAEGPSPSSVNIATASADSTARLWSLDAGKSLTTLDGHCARLSRVKWHPTGKYVGTTSFDTTWRLWDVATERELLLQEGHARETYGISFHGDGSIVSTGDLGGVGHVWDLRSGKSIFVMRKHVKGIMSMDWSPNGWVLATAGADNTVILWDMRKQKASYTLPAHSSMVSQVKFAPTSGEYILTSSYDKTCKLWNTRDWSLLKTLSGHEGYVTGVDISRDEKHFVTASYDRTWKHWAHESEF